MSWGFGEDYFQIGKQLELFSDVYREVNTYYVDDINPGKLLKTGVDGMLKTLDPYTNYYTESEIEDYRIEHVSADYGGIGVTSFRIGDTVMVYDVYEGYAAQKADIRAGDIILSANGRSLKGLTTDQVDELMKGQSGTSITLTLSRVGEAQPLEKKLVREEIKVKNVPYYGMVNNNIGYIKLVSFTDKAAQEVQDALKDLKAKNTLKGVILDLRGTVVVY